MKVFSSSSTKGALPLVAADAVDEDVRRSYEPLGLGEGGLAGGGIGCVDGDRLDAAEDVALAALLSATTGRDGSADRGGGLVHRVVGPAAPEADVGAGLGHADRELGGDAAGAACDDDAPSF